MPIRLKFFSIKPFLKVSAAEHICLAYPLPNSKKMWIVILIYIAINTNI